MALQVVPSLTRALPTVTWAFSTTLHNFMKFTHLNRTTPYLRPWIAKRKTGYSRRKISSSKPQLGWIRTTSHKLTCSHQTKLSSTKRTCRKGSRRKMLKSQGAANTVTCSRLVMIHQGITTTLIWRMTRMSQGTSRMTCQSLVPPVTFRESACSLRAWCKSTRINTSLIALLQRQPLLRGGTFQLDLELTKSQIEEVWTLLRTLIVFRGLISTILTMGRLKDSNIWLAERDSSKIISIQITLRSSCKLLRDNIHNMAVIKGQLLESNIT